MLINSDKYGGIGNDNKLLATLASTIRVLEKENKHLPPPKLLSLQKLSIRNTLIARFQNAKTRLPRIEKLCDDLDREITDKDDLAVFVLTCESIMLSINQALVNIPSTDKEFTLSVAKSYLDLQRQIGFGNRNQSMGRPWR
ncbi:hypothetical protein MJD09_15080 [bacterium]|nr:hypothetical protein [bacterium]